MQVKTVKGLRDFLNALGEEHDAKPVQVNVYLELNDHNIEVDVSGAGMVVEAELGDDRVLLSVEED
jgi:hypothetical protein